MHAAGGGRIQYGLLCRRPLYYMSARHAYVCSGNKILTKRGYRNIEDISLYDKVLTHAGVFREIENVARLVGDVDVYVISA